jgi:hypothetical protein
VNVLKVTVPPVHAAGCRYVHENNFYPVRFVKVIVDIVRSPRLLRGRNRSVSQFDGRFASRPEDRVPRSLRPIGGRNLFCFVREVPSEHGKLLREVALSEAVQEVTTGWALSPSCFRLTGYGRILYTYSVPDQPRQQVVDRAHQRGSRSHISFIWIRWMKQGNGELRIRAYR